MCEQADNNPNNLRVVKTARTLQSINEAAKIGFRPLLKPVEPSKDIHNMVAVFQHRDTGEIILSGDHRIRLGEDYECVIPYRLYYPYFFPEPYAAYLVPPDLEIDERIWLEDIIEDIVAVYGNQGWHPRLESYEAIWTGADFEIQFNPMDDAPRWLG